MLMNEFQPTLRERIIPVCKRVAEVGMAAAALAACTTTSASEAREDLEPLERIDFEYGTNWAHRSEEDASGIWGNACLEDVAAYDPLIEGERNPQVDVDIAGDNPEELTVTLTPAPELYPDASPLVLIGFDDLEHNLVGADEDSRAILERFDCDEEPHR
jgi:hypothetical protein